MKRKLHFVLFAFLFVLQCFSLAFGDEVDDIVFEIMNNACLASYGANVGAYLPDTNYCICNNGYSWDEEGTSCVKGSTRANIKKMSHDAYVYAYDTNRLSRDNSCRDQYGLYSLAGDPGYCICQRLYTWNTAGTECIKITRTMGDNNCKKSYGNNSIVAADDYERCVCKDGYEWNSAGTSCVKKVSCDGYGPSAYLGSDDYCYCKNGYERNYNKNRCVASRNNPNYGGTDFRSATDGGAYINMLLDYEDYMSCLEKGMKIIDNCKAYNGAKCVCKQCEDGYTLNSNGTSCILSDQTCKSRYGNNSYAGTDNLCYCKAGYGWDSPSKNSCVKIEQSCKSWYGDNSYAGTDDLCYCKAGYQRNSDMTSCVKSQATNTTKKYFSDYKVDAYNFAFANGITTMDTIEKADMYGTLDRIAMAKMIGNYAVNILGLIPDVTLTCNFPDVPTDVNIAYDNGVTKACQLGLMGQGITTFRPWDKVTRAEFATVLSRLMNRDSSNLSELNSANPYYLKHMEFLNNNGIIDSAINLSEYDNELRGYVMLMLMRANNFENAEETNCTTEEILECLNYDGDEFDECMAKCKGE